MRENRLRMVTLRTLTAQDWRLWRELRLEALREAPYAFGSKLSEWQGSGDSEQRWRDRLTGVPLNIVAGFKGARAGMVSAIGPDDEQTAELISMWVAPFARGRGVGDALVEAVVRWSRERGAFRLELAVREKNLRAIALYMRNGFVDSGRIRGDGDDEPRERLMTREV